jgi:Na+/proline symporter
MNWLYRTKQRIAELTEQSRMEHDERHRILQLLACRDAFIALIVFGLSFVLLEAREGLTLAGYAILLLTGLIVPVVFVISWRTRGGGFDRPVAAFKVAGIAAGFAVTYCVVGLLALSGILPERFEPPSVVDFILIGVVAVVAFFWLGRKRTSGD